MAVLATAAAAWFAYDVVWGRAGDRPLAWEDRSTALGNVVFERATHRELETREELAALLGEPAPELPYAGRRVYLVTVGPRSSPAYQLEVVGVREENRRVVVTLRERRPEGSERTPAAVVSPYRLLLLPPGERPIALEWREGG